MEAYLNIILFYLIFYFYFKSILLIFQTFETVINIEQIQAY